MNKKLILILVFTMFLVGISYVSAENIGEISDLSSSDVADDVISVDDSLDDGECVSISDADESISTDNSLDDALENDESEMLSYPGSVDVYNWTALRDEVSNDTGVDIVNIKANLTPGSQIFFNRSVTIVGSDDTYIGGSSSSDIANYNNILFFTDKPGISVTLKNIKFQNCRGNNILIQFAGNGNYVLENCIFENMTAPNYRNVIVHLNWGNLNITNCTFENCKSSYGTVSNFRNDTAPDAVHMIVRDTTFKDNYASVEPGCINNCGQLEVYDSTFENNTAAWWAGAIHTHTNANTTIVRSIFRDNLANWNGGALSTYSYLKVVNSTFISNLAKTDAGGGAIYGFNQGSKPYIIVENCDFTNNNASSGNGGAITVVSGTLIVNDSRFDNNAAENNNGGAISSGISTTTINNCNFTNNRAKNMGGAIFAANVGSLDVYNSKFENNYATDGTEIAYYYTGDKTDKAFLTYCNNDFNNSNATNFVFAYPNVNITAYNNTYNEPARPDEENQTGDIVPIPSGKDSGVTVVWTEDFGDIDALTGTPVIMHNRLIIPANHTLYCYDLTTHPYSLAWSINSGAGCFGGLYVTESKVYATCAGDKLYVLDLVTGNSLTNNSLLEGSSMFDPVMYGTNLYISSENGYGPNNDAWITVVDGGYNYAGNILQLYNVTDYAHAMLSEPVIKGDCLYVNTIWGLIRYNMTDNTTVNITNTVGNFVINNDGTIWVLRNVSGSTSLYLLDYNLNVKGNTPLNGNCSQLISDGNGKVYTVDTNGYIHYASHTSYSISCSRTSFHINPVSSAMTYNNGYLYLGDDAGILWVFNVNKLDKRINQAVYWCYNATYPISGGIFVDASNAVYIGTGNGEFYIVRHN